MKKGIVITTAFIALFFCSCSNSKTGQTQDDTVNTELQATDSSDVSGRKITEDMAYEGVNNYCHSNYDWSVAEENPSIMYVTMGEETESEYQVIFRSYTGAFVYFYVEKTSGKTRMVEHVPSLDVEEEAGTIDLFDYIEKEE